MSGDKVAAILGEARVQHHPKQATGAALNTPECNKECFRVVLMALLEPPDIASFMFHHKKHIRLAQGWAEPDGVSELQIRADEWREFYGPGQLLDAGRHSGLQHACVLRLLETHEEFDDIRKLLKR